MLAWIADKNKRDEAFKKSNKFGQNIYNVLKKIDKNNLISKLLICSTSGSYDAFIYSTSG
jgi:hypothetical protein